MLSVGEVTVIFRNVCFCRMVLEPKWPARPRSETPVSSKCEFGDDECAVWLFRGPSVETSGLEPPTPCLQSEIEGTGANCPELNSQVNDGSRTDVDTPERT